jgi:hypothetical protein
MLQYDWLWSGHTLKQYAGILCLNPGLKQPKQDGCWHRQRKLSYYFILRLLTLFQGAVMVEIITLLLFFIEMLQYDWLWSGHMIIKKMFYIPIKLKPELARASMTMSDVNNQWRSNLTQWNWCWAIRKGIVIIHMRFYN